MHSIQDRVISLINHLLPEYGRFSILEKESGGKASSASWKSMFHKRQRPTTDMLETICRLWPEYVEWIMIGKTDTEQYDPINPQYFQTMAIRVESSSTYNNLYNYNKLNDLGLSKKIYLYATYEKYLDQKDEIKNGPSVNLPLVVAVCEVEFDGIGIIHFLFDGLFLHTQRRPRLLEVLELLNSSKKYDVQFGIKRVPFTKRLKPLFAVNLLLQEKMKKMTNETKVEYLSLLNTIPEWQSEE